MSDAMDVDVPLEIHFQPGKLSDLAAVLLAAALLRYKIAYVRRNGAKGAKINALELAHVSAPTSPRKTIDEVYRNVEKSWMSWWYYHQRHIFLNQPSHDSMIDWLDQMIWLPNGSINYEQTAKKILFCDMLTKVQKFQLACAYCFMDHVERLKAELTRNEIKFACLGHDEFDNEFSNYWRGRMRICPSYPGSIDIPGMVIYHFQQGTSLPDNIFSFLLCINLIPANSLVPYDEWSAIEFWFNQCRNEDSRNKIIEVVAGGHPRVIFKILLKLTAFELDSFIKEHCFYTVEVLVRRRNYEYTILIWKHIMVHGISDAVLATILTYLNDNKYGYDQKYVNSLLLEMWLCTSERQKKYIINERVCDFTRKNPNSSEIKKFPPNFPLILDYLSHCDLERKREYWLENWPYLVIPQFGSENRTIIDRIMKLCLVDDQKIEDFKKTKMIEYDRIANYCQWFMENDRINEIQSYLEFCTSDLQLIREVKKKIIKGISNYTMFIILFRGSDEQKRDLFQYLDDVFTENEVKEFLNEFVTRPSNLQQFCYMTSNVTSQELENMIEILEKYVSSEQDLFIAKQHIFKYSFGKTKIPVFLDLIRWCLNVDKLAIENFKAMPSSLDDASNEDMNGADRHIRDILAMGMDFNYMDRNDEEWYEGSIIEELDGQDRNSGHYIFDIFMSRYQFCTRRTNYR